MSQSMLELIIQLMAGEIRNARNGNLEQVSAAIDELDRLVEMARKAIQP